MRFDCLFPKDHPRHIQLMKLNPSSIIGVAFGVGTMVQGEPTAVGTILPESITYSIGEPDESNQFLQNLRLSNFRGFDGQVILLMYHASW